MKEFLLNFAKQYLANRTLWIVATQYLVNLGVHLMVKDLHLSVSATAATMFGTSAGTWLFTHFMHLKFMSGVTETTNPIEVPKIQ